MNVVVVLIAAWFIGLRIIGAIKAVGGSSPNLPEAGKNIGYAILIALLAGLSIAGIGRMANGFKSDITGVDLGNSETSSLQGTIYNEDGSPAGAEAEFSEFASF